MTSRHASCACGQLTATTTSDPVRVSICHCPECQKRSGSAFAAQARFPASAVTFAGESREFTRTGESGGQIVNRFCPHCGSTVWYRLHAQPDLIAIGVGAFADAAFPTPTRSVYETRKHAWVGLPAQMEHEP